MFPAADNDYRHLLALPEPVPSLRVSVVIPVYNRTDLLRLTLAALRVQSYPHELFDVWVVDDGSTEDVAASVAEMRGNLTVEVLRRERDGYGAGQARNLGARSSSADVLVFIDADCVADPDLVRRHARWHHLDQAVVVIGSRHHVDASDMSPPDLLADPKLVRRRVLGSDDPPVEKYRQPDFRGVLGRRTAGLVRGGEAYRTLVSSNFSVSRAGFLEVGGFSEDFHRWGGEDTELGWRLYMAGSWFVPDDLAAVYHQTQTDAGPAGWRSESRRLNQGLLTAKIPHRFYRTSRRGYLYEVPKVSVVVHPVVPPRVRELWEQLLSQTFTDWEALWVGDGSEELTLLSEECRADPRFRLVESLDHAVAAARGELVAFVHGGLGLDHRLLGRSVKRLDDRPAEPAIRCRVVVYGEDRRHVYRTDEDLQALDRSWKADPSLYLMVRRRLLALGSRRSSWMEAIPRLVPVLGGEPLTVLPSHGPLDRTPESVPPPVSDRSLLIRDLRAGGRSRVRAVPRYLVRKAAGRPYRYTAPDRPVRQPDPTIRVRYIGWTGHDNLGDEALLVAVKDLMPWAEVSTSGGAGDLLLLGGGTLINRGYLRHVYEHDSPRVERAVFGTGVANPEYWGTPREDPREWVEFLSTCAYVGVRGPISAEILRSWGFDGRLEVVGDPALALTPPRPPEPQPGRVVISPAYTRGLLWGGDDLPVFDRLAELASGFLAEGRQVVFLSCFPGDDRWILRMMRRIAHPDVGYVAGFEDIGQALTTLADASLVIGERLHACVLAAAVGTPFVALEYRPKLRDFAKSLGMEKAVVRTDQLDLLDQTVKTVEEHRLELAEQMADQVATFRERLRLASDEIRRAVRPTD